MSVNELFAAIGLKMILVVVAIFAVCFGLFFAISYFNSQPFVIKMERTPFYDNTTGSIVLVNNTASLSGLSDCDIYVSGPSKKMKYLETVGCDSLSATEVKRQDLLNLFDNQKGTYTIIIDSEQKSTGMVLQFDIT
jgi:hypothetical protein